MVKEWEMKMHLALNDVIKEDSQDLLAVYSKLKDIVKQENADLQNGDTFSVSMSNQAILRFIYEDNELKLKADLDKDVEYLVSGQDSMDAEYKDLIRYEDKMRENGVSIGLSYPPEFKDLLEQTNYNDMLIFDNGSAYVCTEKNPDDIRLKKVFESHQNDLLKTYHEIEVDFNDNVDIQDLYNEVKNPLTNAVNVKKQDLNQIDKLFHGMKDEKRVKLHLDKNDIKKKKSLFSKEPTWNSENGKISEEKAKIAYAWVKNAPVQIDFLRFEEDKDSTKEKFTDLIVREQVEYLLSQQDFESANNLLKDYSLVNPDLEIRMKSCTEKDNMSFYKNNWVYKNNNIFSIDDTGIYKIDDEKMKTILNNKYGKDFISIKTEKISDVFKKNPDFLDVFMEIEEKAESMRNDGLSKEEAVPNIDIGEDTKEEEVVIMGFDETMEAIKEKVNNTDRKKGSRDMDEKSPEVEVIQEDFNKNLYDFSSIR